MTELPLEAYRTLLVKTLDPIPKSLPALAELTKAIHEEPRLASYNYAIILDISEPTFFRNVKLLRAVKIVRPTTYRLTDEALEILGAEGQVKSTIESVIKKQPSTGWIEDYVISVAKRGLREEEREQLNPVFASLPPAKLNEAMGVFALFALSKGREDMYREKEESTKPFTTAEFVKQLIEHMSPAPTPVVTTVVEEKKTDWLGKVMEVYKDPDCPPMLKDSLGAMAKETRWTFKSKENED